MSREFYFCSERMTCCILAWRRFVLLPQWKPMSSVGASPLDKPPPAAPKSVCCCIKSRVMAPGGHLKLNIQLEESASLHELRVEIRNYFLKPKGWFQSQQKGRQGVGGKEGTRKWLERASGHVNVLQTKCEWITQKVLQWGMLHLPVLGGDLESFVGKLGSAGFSPVLPSHKDVLESGESKEEWKAFEKIKNREEMGYFLLQKKACRNSSCHWRNRLCGKTVLVQL